MLGLLLKKSFWNYWDRMGLMILMNIGYTLMLIVGYLFLSWSFNHPSFIIAAIAIISLGISLYTGMVSGVIQNLVQFKSFQWNSFKTSLLRSLKPSLIYALFILFLSLILIAVIPFYGNILNSTLGVVGILISLWLGVLFLQVLGWYFPLFYRMGDPTVKHLKKCFLVALDNGPISLFLLIWGGIIIVLSFGMILLLPGFTAVLLLWHNALRLIMYKYDYWEDHPEQPKKPIPWKEILREEKVLVGKRGMSDLVRPGKL
ncbi:MAG: hypothetical protein PF447_03140 [Spirochaetaceae bacterium]|nr:hypothetical protein [Spirochaetaceae bacterium]